MDTGINRKAQMATVSEIVDHLFSKPPLDACTYKILVYEKNHEDDKVNSFPFLMDILVSGAKKLFGDHISPSSLSEKQFNVLKQYMLSLGFQVKHEHKYEEGSDKPYLINIWFEQYKCTTDCHGRVQIQ